MKFFLAMLAIVSLVQGHILRDTWAHKNQIDPDYLHMKAMKSLTKGERVWHRLEKANIVSAEKSRFSLSKQVASLQRMFLGFVKGTTNENSSKICSNALAAAAESVIGIIDNRFFWMPDYLIKFNQANDEFTDHTGTAYAYCNLDQVWFSMKQLFNPYSTDAFGRMTSRVLTSMVHQWWQLANCVVDGFLGENYYDVGACSGEMFTITFDVTLG